MDSCTHEAMDDIDMGYVVCIKCGLVLEQFYHANFFENNETTQDACISEREENFLLHRLCEKYFLPDCAIPQALQYYPRFHEQLSKTGTKFNKKILRVYCMYHFMMQQHHAVTLREIAEHCGIDKQKLWQIEKILQNGMEGEGNEEEKQGREDNGRLLETHIQKICHVLNLQKRDALNVLRMYPKQVHKLSSCKPRNVAAALVFSYLLKKCNYKKSLWFFCLQTNLSQSCIAKILKQINV